MTIQVTTQLPTGPTPSLDNNTEDEIQATWPDVSNYGSYRVQIREEGESSWSASAAGFAETTVGHDTTQTTFGGLDDGIRYEVRMRAETEHVDGDWSAPAATTTIFPAPSDLQVDDRFDTVQLSYTDNADSETEVQLQRSPSGAGNWTTITTYPPDTTSVVDDTRVYYQAFDYRIRQITDDGSAISTTVTVIPAPTQRNPKINAKGWTVVVEHPETGRKLHPDVLDEPTTLPSLNSLPEIRIPVRKADVWQSASMDDNPGMDVWLDGEKQPIDELREADEQTDRVILHGVGGVELEQRVQAEYRAEERWLAGAGLVATDTSYSTDFDTPNFETLPDQPVLAASTQAEMDEQVNVPATAPAAVDGGELSMLQTCHTRNVVGEADSTSFVTTETSDDYTGGLAYALPAFESGAEDPDIAAVEFDIDIGYAIPAEQDGSEQLRVAIRGETSGAGTASVRFLWGDQGEDVDQLDVVQTITPTWSTAGWEHHDALGGGFGRVEPGEYTLRIERFDTESDRTTIADTVAIYDDRFAYNFDPDVHEPGGHLDGPRLYPQLVDVQTRDEPSPFSYGAGSVEIDIDDTSNQQRLQMSIDRGVDWEPNTGPEENTASIAESFNSVGSTFRLRFGLSYWEPSGLRDATPRTGYASQTISSWDATADLDLRQLLIDQKYDGALTSILSDIAGEDFLWSYRLVDGTPTVSWTQRGQRVADSDPDLADAQISKDLDVYESVTIKGSNVDRSGRSFTADEDGSSLEDDREIIANSETVYDDDGVNYDRGVDYEMDYSDGAITAIDSGRLVAGESYSIDYSVETSGTYTIEGAGSNPREFVENVPAVTSPTDAEQIAYVLASEFSEPRYAGSVIIPRSDSTFDPLDALPLEGLDLPDDATPLEVRGRPEIAPSGVRLRVGSRGRLEESLSAVASTLRALSRQS